MNTSTAPVMPRRERAWLHGVTLVTICTVIYLAALGVTLYSLEMAYYIPQKWEIIKKLISSSQYFDQKSANQVTFYARDLLVTWDRVKSAPADRLSEADLAQKRKLLNQSIDTLLATSPNVVEVEVEDLKGTKLAGAQALERLSSQHDFSNSIFSRNFSNTVHQSFTTDPPVSRLYGYLHVTVTTARGVPEIDALTSRYRGAMLIAIIFYSLLYAALLYVVIRPLSTVLTYMQTKDRVSASPIIPTPRTILERAYNDLARDAALTRVSKELRDHIATSGTSHAVAVLQSVPLLLAPFANLTDSRIWIFGRKMGQPGWHLEKCFSDSEAEENSDSPIRSNLLAEIGTDDPTQNPVHWLSRPLDPAGSAERGDIYYCRLLQQAQDRLILFTSCIKSSGPTLTAWWLDVFNRLGTELHYALETIEGQRRLILQEKSKANISLSRNLGHDLTNIIATGKLELMTINAFLSLSPAEVNASPGKQEIFRESLQALLNNMRFLQEIVNLYRSFSYLQKPRFEQVEVSELAGDVADLYRLSLPRTIRIDKKLTEAMPLAKVEPRLLRLALFNIMQNAYEAIKRGSTAENPEGTITISTVFRRETNRLEIHVDDSGDGIRDEQGKLLGEDRLPEIFRLGFSTKENQEGEGLGLNWVQTIVREFHGGELLAQNRPGGGARFTVRLPIDYADKKPDVITRPLSSVSDNPVPTKAP